MFWALHSPVSILVYAKMHRRLLAFYHPLNVIKVAIEGFSYPCNGGVENQVMEMFIICYPPP